jgi:hypothetical protein
MSLYNKSHGMSKTRFYEIWKGIKKRCNSLTDKSYCHYGGRGISYDPKWESFMGFKEDMYFEYLYTIKQLKIRKPSIERINVNGNYNRINCTFIKFSDQWHNKTSNRRFKAINRYLQITIIAKSQRRIAKLIGCNYRSINKCLKKLYGNKSVKGYSFEYID